MAKVHGKDSYFDVDDDDITAFVTNIDWPRSRDVAESTGMGVEDKEYLAGQRDGTCSIQGRWDSTASTGPDAVLKAAFNGGVAVELNYGPEGSASGKIKETVMAICTAYNVTSPLGDVVGFSADFQFSGAVTSGTFAP